MDFKFLCIIFFSFLSCNSVEKNKYNEIESSFEGVQLTVERGAFHYDKFILNDTIITFYPEEVINSENSTKYNKVSSTQISKKQRDQFIEELLAKGILKLKSKYTTYDSCTSALKVMFTYKDETKIIQCNDYTRGCPELLQYIENEIIRLHDKNLKRIYLPG